MSPIDLSVFIARNDWRRCLLLSLGGIAFTAVGIGLMFMPMPLIVKVLGAVSVAFFGPIGLAWFGFAVDRRPQLVVDGQGVFARRWSSAIIGWADIDNLNIVGTGPDNALHIMPFDMLKYPPRGFIRHFTPANRRLGFDGILVSLTGYDKSSGALAATLAYYLNDSNPGRRRLLREWRRGDRISLSDH